MGTGYCFHCNNCGHETEALLGIGFTFPEVCKETLNAVREGKYGE